MREGLRRALLPVRELGSLYSFLHFKLDLIGMAFPGNVLSEEAIDWRCERGGQCLPWPRPQEDPRGDEVPV